MTPTNNIAILCTEKGMQRHIFFVRLDPEKDAHPMQGDLDNGKNAGRKTRNHLSEIRRQR